MVTVEYKGREWCGGPVEFNSGNSQRGWPTDSATNIKEKSLSLHQYLVSVRSSYVKSLEEITCHKLLCKNHHRH
jgi:hypothetical protein